MGLSACVITFNEEENIRACMESVAWADEIIVVDSFSTDSAVKICRSYTDKVFFRKWSGFLDQKNYGVELSTNTWILNIDADERVSPALRDQIVEEPGSNDDGNGYNIPRHTYYLRRWIHHGGWYPNYQLRLFRKDKGKWAGEQLREKVTVVGETKTLRNDLLHVAYGSLSDQLKTIDSFCRASAEIMRGKGVRVTLLHLLARPPIKFLETYIHKQKFRDGIPGLIKAIAYSLYVFMRYANTWEGLRQEHETHKQDRIS